jgi:rieske iron-sulfur protein
MRTRLWGSALVGRRMVLRAGLALAPWLATRASANNEPPPDPTEMHPQVGDHFVFLDGPHEGKPAHVEDLPLGGPQYQAYPAAPNGTVRDGSRLNLVILARVGAEGLDDDTKARAADGVVCYSGVCTHQGCPVNMWSDEKKAFVCSCHGSTYNPKHGAELLFGPAPRPLPALPLKSENGLLLVAGAFTSKLGGESH